MTVRRGFGRFCISGANRQLGSTAENLSSLDYQIQKDKERLADIQERIEAEQVRYEPAHEVHKTMAEIEDMGQKTLTGKIAVSKDDYQQLTALAKEDITSRNEIQDLKSSVSYYQRQYFNASSAVERLQERYDRLKEKCQPFLQALEHFPKLVEVFIEKVKELFSIKEAQERKEREDRAAARKEQSKHRRGRNDWERQCRQAGHPRVASEPRALREWYHAHGGRGQKSLRSTQGNL